MDNLTLQDFQAWVNDPMTIKVRDYLIDEIEDLSRLDHSQLLIDNVYTDKLTPLEALGVESVMRLAAVRGIELFTDTDSLCVNLFPSTGEEEDD